MDLYPTDIERMSQVFRNTTSTYKFYWMLALLDAINAGHQKISYNEMVARMLSKAWQPVLNGNFSFGKCDVMIKRINRLMVCSPLNLASPEEAIRCYIINNRNHKLIRDLVKEATKYVPYRFLYPWIGTCSDAEARSQARNIGIRAPYFFTEDGIQVSTLWRDYLLEHNYILQGFTYHHLNLFLEQRNPGFILPMEESISRTADGMRGSFGYIVPQKTGMVAENPFRPRNFLFHNANFLGGITANQSEINIHNYNENNQTE